MTTFTQATLFPDDPAPSSQITLREAYETYHRSATHSPRTVEDCRTALTHWERLTTNPPVDHCTNLTVRQFREQLLAYVPPGRDRSLAAATVRKYVREIRAIFATIGPEQYGNPDGLGLIGSIPCCSLPKCDDPPTVVAGNTEICSIYEACDVATWPRRVLDEPSMRMLEFDAPAWWRTLLVYLYNIGSRRNEFLSLTCAQVDVARRRLYLNPEKHGDRNYKTIHPVLADHLLPFLSPARDRLFACPKGQKMLYRTWHEIQAAAGIQVYRHAKSRLKPYYGFHEIRKTCGTAWAALSEAAAQHMLGHKSINTTRRYYVNNQRVSERVADRFEQPAAFSAAGEPAPPPPAGPPTLRIVG